MPGHSQRLLFAGDTMKNSDQTSEHNMNPKHKLLFWMQLIA